jgi:hypothetical protein
MATVVVVVDDDTVSDESKVDQYPVADGTGQLSGLQTIVFTPSGGPRLRCALAIWPARRFHASSLGLPVGNACETARL